VVRLAILNHTTEDSSVVRAVCEVTFREVVEKHTTEAVIKTVFGHYSSRIQIFHIMTEVQSSGFRNVHKDEFSHLWSSDRKRAPRLLQEHADEDSRWLHNTRPCQDRKPERKAMSQFVAVGSVWSKFSHG
jgi:RNA binding exosome subunit